MRSRSADLPETAVPAANNVVRLDRHRSAGADLTSQERPAPPFQSSRSFLLPLLLLASVVVHAALLIGFDREPTPTPSVGEHVVSIEIVVGADSPAGVGQPDVPQETAQTPVQDNPAEEPARAPETAQAAPQEAQPPPEVEAAARPDPAPAKPAEQPAAKPKPEPPAASAGGVGRGRSTSDTSYIARVVAHMARLKRYPPEAQGATGTAIVSFAIDGEGTVTWVGLARSSTVPALDHEALELVRRASPFPPPPGGRGRDFSAPVTFERR